MIRFIHDAKELKTLLPLIYEDAEAVGIDTGKIQPMKLLTALNTCMEGGAVIVAEVDGHKIGLMTLYAVESYWCDDITLANLIYYVTPAGRKSQAGKRLLLAAREYARARGQTLNIHVESYEDQDRKDLFFTRYGFRKTGGCYKFREG